MSDIYLLQRNNVYYFRIKVPKDLVPFINRREIWKSLKTNHHRSARTAALKLLYHTERLFLHVRSGMFSKAEIKKFRRPLIRPP